MTHLLRLMLGTGLLLFFGSIYAQNPTANFYYTGNCEQDSTTFISTSSTPTGTIYRYLWDFGTGNASDTSAIDTTFFKYTAPGDYLVNLTVWDSIGNSNTSAQIVTINPKPIASMNLDVPCISNAISLIDNSTVSAGSIVARDWTFDTLTTSTLANWLYTPVAEDDYKVTIHVRSDFGCRDSATQIIQYTDTPTISLNLSSPVVLCDGDTVSIVVSGATTYLWNDSSTNRNKALYSAGEYIVKGYTGNNCFAEDTINVDVAPSPVANAGQDTTIDLGFSAPLRGSGGSAYLWTPANTLSDDEIANPIATPRQNTQYLLKVTNGFGCSSYDSVLISVNQVIDIKVHNFITPNGDGHNDAWDLSNIPGLATTNVHVYNRWGWEVYKSDNYKNDWEGTFNEEPLSDGTYIYVIEFNNGILDPLRGTLEIVRNTQK